MAKSHPMEYLLAGSLGGLVAFLFALPAILLEFTQKTPMKNMPIVVDVKTMFGRKLEPREVFGVAILLHIVLAFLFGIVYIVFVKRGWLFITNAPYSAWSLFFYAIGAWLVVGNLIFPALGMGWFGRKEGKRVWAEILASMFLIGLGLWGLVQFFQPFYFVD